MVSLDPFEYTPLAKSHHIRLIILRPALFDAQPIVCSLKEASLNNYGHDDGVLPYEALSYTWGTKHGTTPITCDGRTLLVTPNCESALRNLRLKLKDRVLWIDAICIDQQSVQEKNKQVPLMGKIYFSATRVVIWLGPGLPGDAGVMLRARLTGRLLYLRNTLSRPALSDQQRRWATKLISTEEIDRVHRICGTDWFRRIWTMQELLLAKSATFLIGRNECPSSALYTYFILAEALMRPDSREGRLFRMRSIALEMVSPKSHAKAAWLYSRVTTLKTSPEEKVDDLLSLLLHIAALSDATDVRDKVYGMLALLEGVGVVLPKVDYSAPLTRVFEEFAYCMVRTSNTLWPLELIDCSKADDLPSWVPDLRDPNAVSMKSRWRGVQRRVTHNTEMDLPESGEPGRLPVRARSLATVVEVYERMPTFDVRADTDSQPTDCLSKWTAIATDLDERAGASSSSPDGYYATALQRLTPLLDYLRNCHIPPEKETPQPKRPKRSLFSRDPLEKAPIEPKLLRVRTQDAYPFDDQHDSAALFLTKCGRLGLCKGNVRPSDKVYQLAGGRYPFILRRIGQRSSRDFRLIGTTDVYELDSLDRGRVWQNEIVGKLTEIALA